jgi:hypothetical protein
MGVGILKGVNDGAVVCVFLIIFVVQPFCCFFRGTTKTSYARARTCIQGVTGVLFVMVSHKNMLILSLVPFAI